MFSDDISIKPLDKFDLKIAGLNHDDQDRDLGDMGSPISDLHRACWRGDGIAVGEFIRNSFPLNLVTTEKYFRRTPLHCAAHRGHEPIVRHLLSEGAEPKAKNSRGETPLMEAIYGMHEGTALVFLAAGYWLKTAELDQLFASEQGDKLRLFVHGLLEKERTRFPRPVDASAIAVNHDTLVIPQVVMSSGSRNSGVAVGDASKGSDSSVPLHYLWNPGQANPEPVMPSQQRCKPGGEVSKPTAAA